MSNNPRPLRPRAPGWAMVAPWGNGAGWQNGSTCVVSTLDDAEIPGGGGSTGPQWHLSISRVTPSGQRRPHPFDVRAALRAFGMTDAEEDNHEPGNARHFWLPVDPDFRGVCECKTEEIQVIEPDGHRWSNDPKACRGCEIAPVTGRPCPVHHG